MNDWALPTPRNSPTLGDAPFDSPRTHPVVPTHRHSRASNWKRLEYSKEATKNSNRVSLATKAASAVQPTRVLSNRSPNRLPHTLPNRLPNWTDNTKSFDTILSRPTQPTRVACIYCCDVYSAYRDEFDTCDDDGECGTLLCKHCDVASVVPIVAGSALYGLSDEALMGQICRWHEDGFGRSVD